jgi:two-component system OmpR family response regulator
MPSLKGGKMKILVIEDDQQNADYITKGLSEHGHIIDHAVNGHDGLFLATENSYDVLVIDRMIPKLDGLTLLKTLRDSGVKTPAIFLTALGSIEDRVKGLESGGDDYLVKPFAFSELYARIVSLSRRPPLEKAVAVLEVGDLKMDLISRQVTRAGKPIDLQATEFKLLEFLLNHKGQVVTRTMLLEAVWDFNFDPKTNIVETHISRLRAKMDRDFDKEMLKTVRGAGYILDV